MTVYVDSPDCFIDFIHFALPNFAIEPLYNTCFAGNIPIIQSQYASAITDRRMKATLPLKTKKFHQQSSFEDEHQSLSKENRGTADFENSPRPQKVQKWRHREQRRGQFRPTKLPEPLPRPEETKRYAYAHTHSHRRRADIIQYNVRPSDIICSRAVSSTRAPINLDSISTKRGFMFSARLGLKPPRWNQFSASLFLFRDTPSFFLDPPRSFFQKVSTASPVW